MTIIATHVFTKTPPTQGSRKVVRFMHNGPQFIVYIAQRTNVNISSYNQIGTFVTQKHRSFSDSLNELS